MGWCDDSKSKKNIIKKYIFHLNMGQKNFIEKIKFMIFL